MLELGVPSVPLPTIERKPGSCQFISPNRDKCMYVGWGGVLKGLSPQSLWSLELPCPAALVLTLWPLSELPSNRLLLWFKRA